ncbi:site-specific DNA-methyltransferase [Legionella pneumophila serogroup 1]
MTEQLNELFSPQLVWPGKKEPERLSMPFQTIETINEERNVNSDNWKNHLIWGENLLVINSLLKEFAGKINLIYIDPPFATGQDFSYTVNIGDKNDITKAPSVIEIKAYNDTWGKGFNSYLQMMYERLLLMKDLLSYNGSIYVHCDWRVNSFVRLLLDEIFGRENFLNEIIWKRRTNTVKAISKKFSTNSDTIFIYRKNKDDYVFNIQYEEYPEQYYNRFKYEDKNGRYRWNVMATYSKERLEKLQSEGKIKFSSGAKHPSFKQYLHELKGRPVENIWSDINIINAMSNERLGYATQKPEKLLERIILASSNPNDLIADFFCGSGTTLTVAERLNRKWIGCDLSRFAINVSRKRLLSSESKPFVVQNLGKYERQHWVNLNGKYTGYIKFILELYKAERNPSEFKHLQGRKNHTYIHIGNVDAPITFSEIMEALQECKENRITALDVLGWEWELGINELIHEESQKLGISLNLFQIPQEIMELSAKDTIKYDIQFFELAFLEIETVIKSSILTVTLTDFIIPNHELLPIDLKGKINNWSDFIDYWAVDWLFNEEKQRKKDTFHNMSQRYRTRKNSKLDLSLSYDYLKAGNYEILVKVIDIFGNDTTKHLEIRIK